MNALRQSRRHMAGKALALAASAALMAVLAACSQPAGKSTASTQTAEPPAVQSASVESQDLVVTPIDIAQVPEHARAVVAAMVARMQGVAPGQIDQSLGVLGSARIEADQALSTGGFVRSALVYTAFDRLGSAPERYAIEGYVYFADAADRRAAMAFSARYQLGTETITLEQADWTGAYAPASRVEMFVVPAEAIVAAGAAPKRSYGDYYALASANAVPMRSAASANQGAQLYVIVVFFRDRVPPGSEVAVRISEARDGAGGYGGETRYAVYDNGWPVATIPGRFALNERDSFWVKALVTVGGAERVVGLFSTAPGT